MIYDARPARAGDEPELAFIWRTVFGDGDGYINGYFNKMYEPGRAFVATCGGKAVSMAFAPRLGSLILPDGGSVPCGYIYAVATLPEHRSRGLAARVTLGAVSICEENGEAAVTCPAEPPLFDYYGKIAGFEPFFTVFEQHFSRGELKATAERAERISIAEYLEAREALLLGRSHVRLSGRAAAYQEKLCHISGGGLFKTELGAFAAERAGGTVLVKELLGVVQPAAISAALPAESYILRSPAENEGRGFAMLRGAPALKKDAPSPWLGFAFD